MQIAVGAASFVRARRAEVFGAMGAELPGNSAVQSKSTPTDPVTIVDTESEELIRQELAAIRPGDSILGEEQGGAIEAEPGVRWVVDPIDGTVNFMYGIPAYAVSIAAQIGGVSVAGAVVDVAADTTYSAARGHGASVQVGDGAPRPLRCNDVTDVSMSLLATGFGYGAQRRRAQGRLIGKVLPQVRDIRRVGSAALDLCMVASGLVDAHFEHGLSPWDWAAGSLIASEAGAIVQLPDPNSTSADGQVTVAVAPGIATALRTIFEESGVYQPIP